MVSGDQLFASANEISLQHRVYQGVRHHRDKLYQYYGEVESIEVMHALVWQLIDDDFNHGREPKDDVD